MTKKDMKSEREEDIEICENLLREFFCESGEEESAELGE